MNAAEVKSAVFARGMPRRHARRARGEQIRLREVRVQGRLPARRPLACLLFCMPTAPASQPKTVIISHAIAVLSALCAVAVHDFIPVLDAEARRRPGAVHPRDEADQGAEPAGRGLRGGAVGQPARYWAVLTGPGTLRSRAHRRPAVYFKITDALSGTKAKKA